uniref:Uncharacterized protein n=1 Tax=Eucampia antarctica TaxID=49252 RepID=A0A7S2WQB2_9STRA
MVASGKPLQDGILHGSAPCTPIQKHGVFQVSYSPEDAIGNNIVKTLAQSCCGLPTFGDADDDAGGSGGGWLPSYSLLSGNFVASSPNTSTTEVIDKEEKISSLSSLENFSHIKPVEYVVECDDSSASSVRSLDANEDPVRTFLMTDSKTGRRFAVPIESSGGRSFTDNRIWCFRRGRFCRSGESPDPNFRWTDELQVAYLAALAVQRSSNSVSSNGSGRGDGGSVSPATSGLFGQQ